MNIYILRVVPHGKFPNDTVPHYSIIIYYIISFQGELGLEEGQVHLCSSIFSTHAQLMIFLWSSMSILATNYQYQLCLMCVDRRGFVRGTKIRNLTEDLVKNLNLINNLKHYS